MNKLNHIPVLFAILYFLFAANAGAQKTEVRGVITAGPTISLIVAAVDDFKLNIPDALHIIKYNRQ